MEVAFGPFAFDEATRQLRRGRGLVRLSPKAFELLGLLLARRPQAISKADLHLHLWPRTFVSDGSLAVLVVELRKALGDSAERPRYIRTVPRFGYAFLAEPPGSQSAADLRADLDQVDRHPDTVLSSATNAATAEHAFDGVPLPHNVVVAPPALSVVGHRRVRWPRAVSVTGVVVLALSLISVLAWKYDRADFRQTAIRSLAILPLADLSGDPSQTYFSDGLTEELITRVATIQQLRVLPRSAVMPYRSREQALSDIARELGADAVLDGTVLREGDRVRISVQLVDPHTNSMLWAESFDRALTDVLDLQTDVAVMVAAQLRVTLTRGEEARMARRGGPVNAVAYDEYLRGLAYLERVNRTDAEAAVRALQRAVQLDPNFADALGTLAVAYSQVYGSYMPAEAAALELKAQAAINRALSIDPESADALLARGSLLWDGAHGWPHEESAKAYQTALALKPNLDLARRSLAVIYNHVGLADAALATLASSTETPAVLFQKGLALRIQGDAERALTYWLAIPSSARNANHVGHIAWAQADLGRVDMANALLQRATSSEMDDVNGMLAAAHALLSARAGDRRTAERWLPAATTRATDTRESHHATYLADRVPRCGVRVVSPGSVGLVLS